MNYDNLKLDELANIMRSSDCTCTVCHTYNGKGYITVKTLDGREFFSRFIKNPYKVYDAFKAKKLFY